MLSTSTQETINIGEDFAKNLKPGDVICLYGDLGAGKTQFVKGVAKGLGVKQEITSPTFNICLEYEGKIPLYHFDLYRLNSEEELDDIDFFGIIESGGVCFIEWADKFPDAIPEDSIKIHINVTSEDTRKITKEHKE